MTIVPSRPSKSALDQGHDSVHKDPNRFAILADTLIPGRGEPLSNACVIVEDDKIAEVGHQGDVLAYAANDALPKTRVKVLMPGMWDCHVHLMGIHKVASADIVQSSLQPVLTGARSARDVMLLLDAGFTSVREMGGYGLQLAKAIEEGSLVGPKIYTANAIISQTGGHADSHDMPLEWFHECVSHGLPLQLADGVPECLKAVRLQLRAGAHVIKICGSGGVASERDNPIDQQFSEEELEAIVKEAARAQRIVGAHCHGKAGITASLRAGVKTIEHGSYIDDECVALMKEKDAMLVATRLIIEDALRLGEDMLTPVGYAKLLVTATAHAKAYRLAVKSGVRIALGTDTGLSDPHSLSQGRNGLELTYAVKAGMTPLQAIEACCANGPLALGPQAPKVGEVKVGWDADLIAIKKDPLVDIGVLGRRENISHVWRAGKLYKAPGKAVNII